MRFHHMQDHRHIMRARDLQLLYKEVITSRAILVIPKMYPIQAQLPPHLPARVTERANEAILPIADRQTAARKLPRMHAHRKIDSFVRAKTLESFFPLKCIDA